MAALHGVAFGSTTTSRRDAQDMRDQHSRPARDQYARSRLSPRVKEPPAGPAWGRGHASVEGTHSREYNIFRSQAQRQKGSSRLGHF